MMINDVERVGMMLGNVWGKRNNDGNSKRRRYKSESCWGNMQIILFLIAIFCIFSFLVRQTSIKLSRRTYNEVRSSLINVDYNTYDGLSNNDQLLKQLNNEMVEIEQLHRIKLNDDDDDTLRHNVDNMNPSKNMITKGLENDDIPLNDTLGYFGHRLGDPVRAAAVVEAMRWAWSGYRKHAWGKDELLPVSKTGKDWFGLGLTIVDAMDTLWFMGLVEEFKEGQDWISEHLNFSKNVDVNVFETTIRVLGGLLSCYHLTGNNMFKDKAEDLGRRLLPAFNTPTGIPYSDVNLLSGKAHGPNWSTYSSTSEVTTIQPEFQYLSYIVGDPIFATKVDNAMNAVYQHVPSDGLVPIFCDVKSGNMNGAITLGARGDSYYEYLLKQWLITGKIYDHHLKAWENAVNGIRNKLIKVSSGGLKYVAELIKNTVSPKMDHLVCFLPGALALSAAHGSMSDTLTLARELTETCVQMYKRMPTGLAPEISHFRSDSSHNDDLYVKPLDSHNLLRPETLESLFIMWRVTGEEEFRDASWDIFQSFERYTRVPTGGYSSLKNVQSTLSPVFKDKMESFFLGETLKYLYLSFSDSDILPLDRYVLNTEAHPLPIFDPRKP